MSVLRLWNVDVFVTVSHDSDDVDEDEELEDHEDHEEDYVTDSEDDSDACPCYQHAGHWSKPINLQRPKLRELIQAKLLARFSVIPSPSLHCALLAISNEPDELEEEMQDILTDIATSSSDTFAAALSIYALDQNTDAISELLTSHYHLLRPRDASILQTAVYCIAQDSDFTLQAREIVEMELMDTARTLHAMLRPLFHRMGDEENQKEISQIVKLRSGSASRRGRVDRWVDQVMTPARGTPNPMAIAAFMIGLPIPGGLDDDDEADPLGYLDQADPDLEDLKEELKPNLQSRFQEWTATASIIQGGSATLMKVYGQILTLMPIFKASDIVDEMISRSASWSFTWITRHLTCLGRLSEKPSKHFVCDALDAVASFCNVQKKEVTIRLEKKKRAAATTAAVLSQSSASRSTLPDVSATSSPQPTFPNLSSQFTFKIPPTFGGMDDVD